MTMHKSLKSRDAMKRHRSVLTRSERVAILEDESRWEEGESVFGLPKVRQYVMKRHHVKAVKKEEEGVEGGAAAEGEAAEEAQE